MPEIIHALDSTRNALTPVQECVDLLKKAKTMGIVLVAFTNCPQ